MAVVVLSLVLYNYLRKLRQKGVSPKYLPGSYLKGRWESWKPKGKYSSVDSSETRREPRRRDPSPAAEQIERQTTEAAGVNRNTSIRSIISLPPYSRQPKESEQILGREGERAGIDTVLETPETAEEEESRREDEMESLFQIRQARRREIAEREERRRLRREARQAGDYARLEQLRRDSLVRREQSSLASFVAENPSVPTVTSSALIAEHNARGRDRRVSSVAYAQVGQVRHDGTRIRSNSHESENSGLLSGAAPMGSHSRNGSEALLGVDALPRDRYRDRSDSGAVSISTMGSSFENVSRQPTNEEARPTTSRTTASSHSTESSISELDPEESDIGAERMIVSGTDSDESPSFPPEYEGHDWGDAPAYMSRANSVATQRNRNSGVFRAASSASRRLSIPAPTIQVEAPTGPNTPIGPNMITEEDEEETHPEHRV